MLSPTLPFPKIKILNLCSITLSNNNVGGRSRLWWRFVAENWCEGNSNGGDGSRGRNGDEGSHNTLRLGFMGIEFKEREMCTFGVFKLIKWKHYKFSSLSKKRYKFYE